MEKEWGKSVLCFVRYSDGKYAISLSFKYVYACIKHFTNICSIENSTHRMVLKYVCTMYERTAVLHIIYLSELFY